MPETSRMQPLQNGLNRHIKPCRYGALGFPSFNRVEHCVRRHPGAAVNWLAKPAFGVKNDSSRGI